MSAKKPQEMHETKNLKDELLRPTLLLDGLKIGNEKQFTPKAARKIYFNTVEKKQEIVQESVKQSSASKKSELMRPTFLLEEIQNTKVTNTSKYI